jgi:hypothetical protein
VEQGQAFGEVAAVGDLPFVVGLNQHGAGEAQQGVGVEEDTDDVCAPDYCGRSSSGPFGPPSTSPTTGVLRRA